MPDDDGLQVLQCVQRLPRITAVRFTDCGQAAAIANRFRRLQEFTLSGNHPHGQFSLTVRYKDDLRFDPAVPAQEVTVTINRGDYVTIDSLHQCATGVIARREFEQAWEPDPHPPD